MYGHYYVMIIIETSTICMQMLKVGQLNAKQINLLQNSYKLHYCQKKEPSTVSNCVLKKNPSPHSRHLYSGMGREKNANG